VKRARWIVTRWNIPGSAAHGSYFCRQRTTGGDSMRTCGKTHLTRTEAQRHAEGLNRDREAGG
jgi:hypothetical protein